MLGDVSVGEKGWNDEFERVKVKRDRFLGK